MNCEPVHCPECGEELGYRDEVYIYEGGDLVVGCSLCIDRQNATEWYANMEALMNEGQYSKEVLY